MDSGNNNIGPERFQAPQSGQPNLAPGVGNIAANMVPNNPNLSPGMPDLAPLIPEVGPLGSSERLSNPESQRGPYSGGSTVQDDAVIVAQQVVADSTIVPAQATQQASTPTTAADEDLIEKEWVDQIKKAVAINRDDPYSQAHAVAELVRDYVKKRYGKEVGKAPNDI